MTMANERIYPAKPYLDRDLTADQERRLDHIVDTTGCSYDDAMRIMGLPVDDPKEVGNLITRTPSHREVGEKTVQAFFCGDCCMYIEPGKKCPHVRVGNRGGRYTSDSSRY